MTVAILKIRLHMVDVYSNYKGDLRKVRRCPYCKEHKDTTEHLLVCPNVEGRINDGLKIIKDVSSKDWRDIVKRVENNLSNRE